MATHLRILAWRIPWTEEPDGLQSMGLQRVGKDWSGLACTQGPWNCLKINQNDEIWSLRVGKELPFVNHQYPWMFKQAHLYRIGVKNSDIKPQLESQTASIQTLVLPSERLWGNYLKFIVPQFSQLIKEIVILRAPLSDKVVKFNPPTNAESSCQCRRCKRCRFNPWVRKNHYRRAWQPTPGFLPGEPHGQRSLAGYKSVGLQRVGHD